jgi:hypothetical protein
MAILTPPDRGQPIDVPYIYTMVTALNTVADQVNASAEKYTTVYTRELADPQNLRTSDTKFYASFVDIVQNETVIVGATRSFSFNIQGARFKYPPIATVTPVNTGTSSVSNDVSLTITSVTNSRIDGIVRFNSGGTADVAVNVIAIGIPE